MSRQQTGQFVWSVTEGGITDYGGRVSLPALQQPDTLARVAENIDIRDGYVMVPRPGFADDLSTSGTEPTTPIRHLFEQAVGTAKYLWAWASSGSAAMTAHRWDGSTWTQPALSDTVANLAEPHCIQYNGKLFAAYDSNVNRLHVYDGTAWRRVGIEASAAATVANTGAGAYAATLRYYKISWEIISGSDILVRSELSPSVSFTPSGAGTAARITKPTTPDSATHWGVYGSADNISYYELFRTVVATTTVDDVTNPGDYGGPAAPNIAVEAGYFVPPPSAKYLATDGTRLLMAGAFETSAASGQTTPKVNRVWFTRPIGALDVGDDESITQTGDLKYWIDVNDEREDSITGLYALDGLVYVFFEDAVYRLVPTGLDDVPYRVELVSTAAGASSQNMITRGSMPGSFQDALYFMNARTGIYRLSASGGVEHLGYDRYPRGYFDSVLDDAQLAYNRLTRHLWVLLATNSPWALAVDYLSQLGREKHGGWAAMPLGDTAIGVRCAANYADHFQVAGSESGNAKLLRVDNGNAQDDGSTFTATVTKQFLAPLGSRMRVEEPWVYVSGNLANGTVTVSYSDGADIETGVTGSVTLSGEGTYIRRVEGVSLANVSALIVSVSTQSGIACKVERVVIPYTLQESI